MADYIDEEEFDEEDEILQDMEEEELAQAEAAAFHEAFDDSEESDLFNGQYEDWN